MRIAIVGAGAIGSWLAVHLAEAGHQVCALARGETLAAIRRDGLRLDSGGSSRTAKIVASDRAADLGAQDLVVIAVKSYALAAAAPAVAQLSIPRTAIVPAMNGVPWWFPEGLGGPLENVRLRSIDPDGTIAATISVRQVIGCVVHASCSLAAPAHVVHASGNRLIVGDPHGATSDRLECVREAFAGTGIELEVSTRIQQDIWYKLWGNMTINPISALTGALTDRILDDGLVREFMLAIMAEAAEIGRRIHCPIAESGDDRIAVARRLGPFKTSMLQDAELGRPLEIDALLAAPREIAAKVGVDTPFLDALYGLVRLYAGTQARLAASMH